MIDALASGDAADRMALMLTMETLADSPFELLDDDSRLHLNETTDPFAAYRACAVRFKSYDAVQQMLLTDISLQLPSQFLTKVDRATMALGLEARVPLLDERIARLAVNLPARWKLRGSQSKSVLREAFRSRLPAAIVEGPKTGFGVPYEYWLRTTLYELARDAILSSEFLAKFGFDRRAVSNALEDHRLGKRDRGFMLWKLLQLALWARVAA
jgi:asparagine synthase (glutamine-hydrolysing)